MKKKRRLKIRKKLKIQIILLFIVLFPICIFFNLIKNNEIKNNTNIEQSIDYKYILVNKKNGLKKDFEPKKLVKVEMCSSGDSFLEEETANAYLEMCIASQKENQRVSIASAYRSYEEQKKLYDSYLKSYGKNYVDRYVAPAGYSEHQTGLAIDLKSLDTDVFKNSNEYLWIVDNSYKYGFILRYQKGKEKITGYTAEEWHVRYVGKEVAKYIYDNNITYEEYYKLFILNN